MTDKERLSETFTALGIKHEIHTLEEPRRLGDGWRWSIDSGYDRNAMAVELIGIGEGVGYMGFFADFYFDAQGKFVGHCCAE